MSGVYTLDAVFASLLLLSAALLAVTVRYLVTPSYTIPSDYLADLINEPEFLSAVYSSDIVTVEAYLNSLIPYPYNFTVYDSSGNKVFSVGVPLEGAAASVTLGGWRGESRTLTLSLKVAMPVRP
mgnify:CR=1 FL=1